MSDSDSDGFTADPIDGLQGERLLAALERTSRGALVPKKRRRGRPSKKRRMTGAGSPDASSQGTSTIGSPLSQVPDLATSDPSISALLTELIREVKEQGRRFQELLDEAKSLKETNDSLKRKIKTRDEEIVDLRFRLENLEQREKQNEVVVSCPSIESMDKENFSQPMVNLLKDKLDMSDDELSQFSFRKIGRRALVTVPSAVLRRGVFAAARSRRPRNFFVNESLTPTRSKFFYEVRSFLKTLPDKMITYTMFGVVYIKKNKTSDPVVIKSLDDLKLFLQVGAN